MCTRCMAYMHYVHGEYAPSTACKYKVRIENTVITSMVHVQRRGRVAGVGVGIGMPGGLSEVFGKDQRVVVNYYDLFIDNYSSIIIHHSSSIKHQSSIIKGKV